MKSLSRFSFVALLLTLIPGSSSAQGLPEFRPALLGHGRRSLVNLINTESRFGAAAAGPILDAAFIPGFRNGKAVACRFNWSLMFFGSGRQMKSG